MAHDELATCRASPVCPEQLVMIIPVMGECDWADRTSEAFQQAVEICSYTIAHKHGDELMCSMAHRRSRSRYVVASWLMCSLHAVDVECQTCSNSLCFCN